jgi:tripartite-type tricarboxylate transporter receptor subunit TctC
VIGGQISMMMDIISTASTYIHSGKVRAVAVLAQRNASLPDVPTFAESGIEGLKGFDVGGWYGVYGPKGMSPELVAKLNKAINAAAARAGKATRNWATTNGPALPRRWPSAPPRSAPCGPP